jgi:3'-phosphoadenosine 5'-phosphosulfate sulfotransferase (PAPS reductase)/FAD synthetase
MSDGKPLHLAFRLHVPLGLLSFAQAGQRKVERIPVVVDNSVPLDEQHRLIKVNPLFDWTCDQVLAFIREHGIPYNPLHDQGFLSIGCAPCTRAVAPGEPERAGRWWWEDEQKKECGLHHRHRPQAPAQSKASLGACPDYRSFQM